MSPHSFRGLARSCCHNIHTDNGGIGNLREGTRRRPSGCNQFCEQERWDTGRLHLLVCCYGNFIIGNDKRFRVPAKGALFRWISSRTIIHKTFTQRLPIRPLLIMHIPPLHGLFPILFLLRATLCQENFKDLPDKLSKTMDATERYEMTPITEVWYLFSSPLRLSMKHLLIAEANDKQQQAVRCLLANSRMSNSTLRATDALKTAA